MWQGRGRGDRMLQEDPATTPPEDNKQQLLQPTATSCNAPWRKGGSQLERIRIGVRLPKGVTVSCVF